MLHDPSFALATDLDGTFLGGSPSARERLYRYLQRRRAEVLLMFVTGRDLPFIEALSARPDVPRPHVAIGDVGTTVVSGDPFAPLEPVQSEIERRWNGSEQRVKELLSDVTWLKLQDCPMQRRVSYFYEPADLDPAVVARIEAEGYDCITSADLYLDVMPRGVAKGPTLLQTISALGIDPARVLVAGDTLNDLSLFETGLKGVAVGNSEPELLERTRSLPHVYHSPHEGAAGIWDALGHFELFEENDRS